MEIHIRKILPHVMSWTAEPMLCCFRKGVTEIFMEAQLFIISANFWTRKHKSQRHYRTQSLLQNLK